jgi:hypothetical protein
MTRGTVPAPETGHGSKARVSRWLHPVDDGNGSRKGVVPARARSRLTLLPRPFCTVRIEHPAARRWAAEFSRLRHPAGRFTARTCRNEYFTRAYLCTSWHTHSRFGRHGLISLAITVQLSRRLVGNQIADYWRQPASSAGWIAARRLSCSVRPGTAVPAGRGRRRAAVRAVALPHNGHGV